MALKVTDRKFYRYIVLKLMRQKGTPNALALSVAIGIFFGFLIPLGQMILAVFVAWIFKVNKIVAAACTWVTNPITIPLIFPFNIYLGSFFIDSKVDKELIVNTMKDVKLNEIGQLGATLGTEGVLMFVIGGSLLGAFLSPFAFTFVYFPVKRNRERKVERSLKKKLKRQQKLEQKQQDEIDKHPQKKTSVLPISEQ